MSVWRCGDCKSKLYGGGTGLCPECGIPLTRVEFTPLTTMQGHGMPVSHEDVSGLHSRISALETEVKELREQVKRLMDAHPRIAGPHTAEEFYNKPTRAYELSVDAIREAKKDREQK